MSTFRAGSVRMENPRWPSQPWCDVMKLRDTSLPVLILQMQHHGALGAMRSLGRLGVPMYGVHATRRPVASFSKYCRKVFALDVDETPPEQAVERLREIARDIGTTPLLLPTND